MRKTASAVAAILLATVTAAAANASPLCGERQQIVQRLAQAHGEQPQALGLSSDGGVLEILASEKGGWTILVTYPKRPTCIVAVGEGWQTLQLAGDPA